jgi:hypothetical protein
LNKENVVYIYILEYYSAIKEKEIMSFAEKWMEMEVEIKFGEKRKTQKPNIECCMSSLICEN